MKVSKYIQVKGRVQGVGYRFATKHAAQKMNITGTVKNLPDGSVEIYASGESESVSDFINWCHNGPARANVMHVIINDLSFRYFKKFSIL